MLCIVSIRAFSEYIQYSPPYHLTSFSLPAVFDIQSENGEK